MTYGMRYEKYEAMYNFEERFWWFAGIRAISEAIIRSHVAPGPGLRILDAGCGTGLNINWLTQLGPGQPVIGMDYSHHALKFCKKRDLRFLCQGSVTDMPFRSNFYDLVTSFDVMSHIPRGEPFDKAFAEYYRILRPGGLLFVRSSAYQWLKSNHDDDLNAPNRYCKSEFAQTLTQVGFRPERITYANTLAFPLALAARLAKKVGFGGSDVRPLPQGLRWVETLLRSLLMLEARFLAAGHRRFPFGLSLFAVARK